MQGRQEGQFRVMEGGEQSARARCGGALWRAVGTKGLPCSGLPTWLLPTRPPTLQPSTQWASVPAGWSVK